MGRRFIHCDTLMAVLFITIIGVCMCLPLRHSHFPAIVREGMSISALDDLSDTIAQPLTKAYDGMVKDVLRPTIRHVELGIPFNQQFRRFRRRRRIERLRSR